MSTFADKLQRIAEEKQRLADEEVLMGDEALAELDSINQQIEALEEKKEQLEALLGIDDAVARAGHGQIMGLCLSVLSANSSGMTTGQIKEAIERDTPGVRLSSVPGTLSRLSSQGRLRRDELGKYHKL